MMPTIQKTIRMFNWIKGVIQSTGEAPTIEEIGRQFGMSSPSSVHKHLQKMKKLDWITVVPNVSRGVRIIEQLKHCPICNKDLPVSEFGRNAYYVTCGAKDGRNLYCKSCVRAKVGTFRAGRKNWRHVQKERKAKRKALIEAMLMEPELKPELPTFKLPTEKVFDAIANGKRTQKEIWQETKLSKDQICDAIANLLLWTKEIRTQVIEGTRMYFINEVEEKSIVEIAPVPFFDIAGKLGAPRVQGEKRIERRATINEARSLVPQNSVVSRHSTA